MKKRKILLPILVLLLLITSVLLFKIKSEKDVLQKNIERTFTNAISDSMGGLSKDYRKLGIEYKIQCYYQTVDNLKDALDVFHNTSYKEYNNLFQTLNRLYIHLLRNHSEDYEIDDKLFIFEFLGKILVFPEDNQLISEFNNFLDK
jgi:hypothetical protein